MKALILSMLVFIGLGCVEHPKPIKIYQAPLIFTSANTGEYDGINYRVTPDTGFLTIWYSIMFREGYLSNIYTCPGGKKSSGFGNTHNPKPTTEREAAYILYDTLYYYYGVVSTKYPLLSEQQKWAVVSIAANCKWNTIFGQKSSFNKALLNQECPAFEKWCYDAKGNKRMNLLQSRLYEKALFTNSDSLIWINPYRGYTNEETTVFNLQQWYKDHYQDRYGN